MRASKAKSRIHSLLTTGRQMFSHLESRALSSVIVAWEDKCHHSECAPSPPPLHPSFYYWAWPLKAWDIPLGSLVSCPVCVPSQLLVHPQPSLAGRMVWETERTLTLQALLCNNSSIGVLATLFWSQIQNIAPYELLWRKLSLCQLKPGQSCACYVFFFFFLFSFPNLWKCL